MMVLGGGGLLRLAFVEELGDLLSASLSFCMGR